AHAVTRTAKAAMLCRQRILDALSPQLEQAFHPASVAVVKHAGGVVGRDHVMAAGANGAVGSVDSFVSELLRDQPDLSPVLHIDQPVFTEDPAVPERVRAQEMRGGEERPVGADDTKAVRDSVPGNFEQPSIVVRRAPDRYQAI